MSKEMDLKKKMKTCWEKSLDCANDREKKKQSKKLTEVSYLLE